ncbi:hypothetical protein [Streptomyces sp. NPDC054940]
MKSSLVRRFLPRASYVPPQPDTSPDEAQANQATECARCRLLDQRLTEAQVANEGHYRAQYDAAGGPRFDPAQPFGAVPAQGGAA